MALFEITYKSIDFTLVFGSMLGISLILMLENLANDAVTFVKGWKS